MPTAEREIVQRMYAADAHAYDRVRLEEERGVLLSRHDLALFEAMLPDPGPGWLVLEAGAGTGRFTLAALNRGHTVIATDINDSMLALLRQKVEALGLTDRCNVREADIFRLDFPDAHFDLAISLHVIPRFLCLEDQRAAIKEVARTLKPGGKLLFNYRNSRSFYAAAYQGHAATPGQIRAILDEAGLRIVITRGKWLLNKKVLSRLPLFAGRALAAVDRGLRRFWTGGAWDVFVLAEKRPS